MLRAKSCSKLVLVIAAVVVFGLVSGAVAAEKSGTEFNYPVAKSTGDLGFYKQPDQIEPYPVIKGSKVKNIILCIGDGMGLGHVTLARLAVLGAEGKLYMERMPVAGFVRTHSASSLVTDSAASGTAMATGFKTNNRIDK